MEAFSHPDSEQLHKLDLMVLYLKDQTDPEETEHIEHLLESDPLYRLAMEAVLDSLLTDPLGTKADLLKAEAEMPILLDRVRDQFSARQIPAMNPPISLQEQFRSLPAWQKWLGGLALLLGFTFLLLSFLNPGTGELPQAQLTPDSNVQHVAAYVDRCGEMGIGRGMDLSINATMVEQYAQGSFAQAARELKLLGQNPTLSSECQLWTQYFIGQSHLGAGQWEQAKQVFGLLADQTSMPGLQAAGLWYQAQLALQTEESQLAKSKLTQLLELTISEDQHLLPLQDVSYLEEARHILAELP
ncbi:MAG: hypothetical protein AAF399_18190 [Bacteroidota bacterium]